MEVKSQNVRIAEIAAMIRFAGELSIVANKPVLEVELEVRAAAERLRRAITRQVRGLRYWVIRLIAEPFECIIKSFQLLIADSFTRSLERRDQPPPADPAGRGPGLHPSGPERHQVGFLGLLNFSKSSDGKMQIHPII